MHVWTFALHLPGNTLQRSASVALPIGYQWVCSSPFICVNTSYVFTFIELAEKATWTQPQKLSRALYLFLSIFHLLVAHLGQSTLAPLTSRHHHQQLNPTSVIMAGKAEITWDGRFSQPLAKSHALTRGSRSGPQAVPGHFSITKLKSTKMP